MARGGGGLAGVLRGSGGRREAGSADEPRTEPELERAAGGGRAGARRSRAGARARGGGAAGTVRRANARRRARAGDRPGRGRGVGAAFLARLGWARASGPGLQARGLRGGGCGGARAPGGAGTCGGGETEPRRVRGKAVLILTPNVFGESCRRGTLEGGGVEATDRLTAAAGEPPLLPRGQEAPSSLEATSSTFRVVPGGGSYPLHKGAASCIKKGGTPLLTRCLVGHITVRILTELLCEVGRGSLLPP